MTAGALRQVRCPTCNRWLAEVEGVRLRLLCKTCGAMVTMLERAAGEVVIVAIDKRRAGG